MTLHFCALAGWMALVSAAQSADRDVFRWHGHVAEGRVIEIKGVNGPIYAEPASGPEAEIVATKTARHSDPRDVEIQIAENSEGLTVCAVYPSSDPARSRQCEPGMDAPSGGQNSDVVVSFTVRVPTGVRFVGRTVNGDVEAVSLDDDAEAYTVSGKIRIDTAGGAQARTVNGSIRVAMGETSLSRSRELSTVNGGIIVDLPPAASAEVDAHTANGNITCDFPVRVREFSRRRLFGSIGRGGRALRLKTVNGPIHLRRTI